jgi:GNAT superfamily N-acetyltransferase
MSIRIPDNTTISFAGREALPEVHVLVRQCYGKAAEPLDWWAWRYFGTGSPPSEFCLARVGSILAGIQPVSWTRFRFGEAFLRGGVLTGVMVHPNYRRRGLFSMMIRACERRAWEQGIDFLMTMPNDRSRPGFLKLGWTVPRPRTLLVKVLDPEEAARRIPGGILLLYRPLLRALFRTGSNRADAEPLLPAFTPPIGLPWTESGLAVERSGEWLQWRYWDRPGQPYRCWIRQDSTGFGAYDIRKWGDLNVAFVLETRSSTREGQSLLLSAMAEAALQEGASVAAAVESSPADIKAYRRAGFRAVPACLAPKRFWLAFTPNPSAPLLPRTIGAWALHLADWDGV